VSRLNRKAMDVAVNFGMLAVTNKRSWVLKGLINRQAI